MRKSMPVARISASTCGSIRPGGGGGATVAMSSGSPSHCAALKTVKRFRNGIFPGFLAGLAGAALLVLGREAVGIDDSGAALALAHIAAERKRLAEGEPALAGKAVLDHGAPEDQDVDAGISRPVLAFLGRPSGALPWTSPRAGPRGSARPPARR
jgi:hypothetical protein